MVRQIVVAKFGGFEDAADEQILSCWNSLDETTKKRYLAESKENKKGGDDAGRTGS